MALPKRTVDPTKVKPAGETWTDPEFWDQYPSIHAFMFDVQYEGGERRIPGGIGLYTKLGVLSASVYDNDRGCVAYVNATTFSELLFKIEEGICNDNLDWKGKSGQNHAQKPPF